MVNVVDIIEKAREYQKTKSITTAAEVCNMLADWADETQKLINGGDDEQ